MKRPLAFALSIGVGLSACSSQESGSAGDAASVQDAATSIAYGYTYRFRLPGGAVHEAQDKHIALCDRLGAERCRMLEMHRSSSEGSSSGSTRFMVAAGDARKFGQDIVPPVTSLGGELTARDFEAEDLARQSAETAAKAAEKNTAANRAALSQVRERLAASPIWVYYEGVEGFSGQVAAALGAAGDTLTTSIVALIYFLAAALPWFVVLGTLFFAIRAIWRRLGRWTGRASAPVPSGSPERDDAQT